MINNNIDNDISTIAPDLGMSLQFLRADGNILGTQSRKAILKSARLILF